LSLFIYFFYIFHYAESPSFRVKEDAGGKQANMVVAEETAESQDVEADFVAAEEASRAQPDINSGSLVAAVMTPATAAGGGVNRRRKMAELPDPEAEQATENASKAKAKNATEGSEGCDADYGEVQTSERRLLKVLPDPYGLDLVYEAAVRPTTVASPSESPPAAAGGGRPRAQAGLRSGGGNGLDETDEAVGGGGGGGSSTFLEPEITGAVTSGGNGKGGSSVKKDGSTIALGANNSIKNMTLGISIGPKKEVESRPKQEQTTSAATSTTTLSPRPSSSPTSSPAGGGGGGGPTQELIDAVLAVKSSGDSVASPSSFYGGGVDPEVLAERRSASAEAKLRDFETKLREKLAGGRLVAIEKGGATEVKSNNGAGQEWTVQAESTTTAGSVPVEKQKVPELPEKVTVEKQKVPEVPEKVSVEIPKVPEKVTVEKQKVPEVPEKVSVEIQKVPEKVPLENTKVPEIPEKVPVEIPKVPEKVSVENTKVPDGPRKVLEKVPVKAPEVAMEKGGGGDVQLESRISQVEQPLSPSPKPAPTTTLTSPVRQQTTTEEESVFPRPDFSAVLRNGQWQLPPPDVLERLERERKRVDAVEFLML
jgi:hypothetical protein